jgi:hypothetical protein
MMVQKIKIDNDDDSCMHGDADAEIYAEAVDLAAHMGHLECERHQQQLLRVTVLKFRRRYCRVTNNEVDVPVQWLAQTSDVCQHLKRTALP